MIFDELDKQMRVYEQSLDQIILPETYMVARLDGRGFTRLTKEVCKFEAPFDVRFRDLMTKTVEALMDCGFRVVYGFTFKYNKKNVITLWPYKGWIEIVLNAKLGTIDDKNDLIYDISNRKWSSEQYAFKFNEDTDMKAVKDIVEQTYLLKKK